MNCNVLGAIFRRNLVSYFSSPTGYVFVCVFVMLSSIAAIWPNEFFNSNLANLDQLSFYLPYIMLVFIPAITMSIWADESRQGTDELVLTIPANDADVVLGKFFAALGIFTISLVFSMLANLWVLNRLGEPDLGLFVGTYVGYWFVGAAMVSVGMVASFLTSNLTVAFTLGTLFNAPLAFAALADSVMSPGLAAIVKEWSVTEQFQSFQRGVISISGVSYFVMITVVMLYLSIVLIGRRHWMGGRDGSPMLGHYAVRTFALVAIAVGINIFFSDHDVVRWDVTSEKLSSLSPETRKLIAELEPEYPVMIEAFVSPQVPTEYAQMRLNLISTLEELRSIGGDKIKVVMQTVENFSQEAALAEQKYGITAQSVMSKQRGARTQEEIYMGVVFTCGLDRVVLPFVNKGIPVEYELVRSISTVAQQERKRVGVLKTDVALMGGFDMQTMSSQNESLIIQELRKQHDVVEVDPSSPITERYDVLLAVQPSTLTPPQMENFIAAVQSGQPTAIFEDPFPLPNFFPNVAGTVQPKRPPQSNPFMPRQPPPQPKGDISKLWNLLGVDMVGEDVIWQTYNPYPKAAQFIEPEWVFIDSGARENFSPFNEDDAITSGMEQLLFLYAGAWRKLNTSKLDFTELVVTGTRTGSLSIQDLRAQSQMGGSMRMMEMKTGDEYVVVARVRGKVFVDDVALPGDIEDAADDADAAADDPDDAEEDGQGDTGADDDATEPEASTSEVNVVLVADIDCVASAFFFVRAQGTEADADVNFHFQNVSFVLNALDSLADDDRFVEIRKRRATHRTLTKLDKFTEESRIVAAQERAAATSKAEMDTTAAQQALHSRIAELRNIEGMGAQEKAIKERMAQADGQRKLNIQLAKIEQKRDKRLKENDRNLSLEIRKQQDWYKTLAVLIPPIPPIVLGFFFFFYRRNLEQEGVSKSRLR